VKGSTKVKVIVFFALVAAALVPMAAQTVRTGGLTITGTVPEIFTLTVTPAGDAQLLDLTINATDHLIATVVEKSNKKAGYTLTVTSANSFAFAGTTGDTLPYTLTYASSAVTVVAGSATLSNVSTKTSSVGTSNPLAISYNGIPAFLSEGAYTDTLTLTMTSK
jgi:hypothetical protein